MMKKKIARRKPTATKKEKAFDGEERQQSAEEVLKEQDATEETYAADANDAKKKKKNKALRIAGIAACVLAVLALVAVGAVTLLIRYYYNLTNYVSDDDVTLMDVEYTDEDGVYYRLVEETDEDGNVIGYRYEEVDLDSLSDEERASYEVSVEDALNAAADQLASYSELELATSDSVYNLLLIGVDLRAGETWNGNSDSMILISINSETKTIYMTSFMRDLYANIPGVGTYKLNRAHAVGGGPLLVQTIEENYRISINSYASVNFYSLIEIIDSIGGISMELSADEVSVANNYIASMCSDVGLDPNDYYLSGSGTMHLNGMQAVAYSRIRYVGNADFGRTERQRKVLTQIFETLKTKSVSEINSFLTTALPNVTHNIDASDLTALLFNAPSYLGYDLVSLRVPLDGYYTYVGEMLLPDFDYTINYLRELIYN